MFLNSPIKLSFISASGSAPGSASASAYGSASDTGSLSASGYGSVSDTGSSSASGNVSDFVFILNYSDEVPGYTPFFDR